MDLSSFAAIPMENGLICTMFTRLFNLLVMLKFPLVPMNSPRVVVTDDVGRNGDGEPAIPTSCIQVVTQVKESTGCGRMGLYSA